jgi:hypothetical protein
MSDEKDVTSAGVPWSEVPEFARHHVEWMDGRHGSSQRLLPSLDEVPVISRNCGRVARRQ